MGIKVFKYVLFFNTKKGGSISLTQFTKGLKNELNHHTFISFHLKWNWNHYVIVLFIRSQSTSLWLFLVLLKLLFSC
jgi:hypothetical protein